MLSCLFLIVGYFSLVLGTALLSVFLASPAITYFIAHKIRNKKWLTRYAYFWISISFVVNCQILFTEDTHPPGHIPTWMAIAFFILLSCTTAITGVITKSLILYFKLDKKEIHTAIINLIGFFSIPLMGYLIIVLPVNLIRFTASIFA